MKKLIASLAATLVLAIGIFAVTWFSQGPVHAQQNPPAPVVPVVQSASVSAAQALESEQRMQEEIAELRALIQVLLGMIAGDLTDQSGQNAGTQPGVPQMSSQAAMNTAVEHLGFGTAQRVELLEVDGVLMFVVDVANGTIRYAVHVNAMTGDVVNFNTSDAISQATQ